MISSLLDLLFPRHSLAGQEGEWITDAERMKLASSIHIVEREVLSKKGIHAIDRLIAVSTYRDHPLLRKAIHTLKYKRLSGIAPVLQEVFAQSVCGYVDRDTSSCITPVPLHWMRQFQRGYNQSAFLADALSHATGVEQCPLLLRARSTGHQAHRTRAQRLLALQNAFRYRSSVVAPQTVYLVDDVCTTGATLQECATVLRKAGVSNVIGLVLAHDTQCYTRISSTT